MGSNSQSTKNLHEERKQQGRDLYKDKERKLSQLYVKDIVELMWLFGVPDEFIKGGLWNQTIDGSVFEMIATP